MDSTEEISDSEDEGHGISQDDSLYSESGGVVVVNNTLSSSNSDSDDHTDTGFVRQFDIDIPTMHKYLGKLDSIGGYSIFDDGECLKLIAIYTNTIVSPGFILPLVIEIPSEQDLIRTCIASKCVFAVVFENERREIFPVGIIMEVFESFTKKGVLYLKSRGRQRCQILRNHHVRHLGGRFVQVYVKAIAEQDIKSPISCTQLLNLKAIRRYCYEDCESLLSNSKYRRWHLAQFPYASWVYNQNEVSYYCKVVTDLLSRFYIRDCLPKEPVSLSYWFLQNFLLLHGERLEILKANTVLDRLKMEYKYMLMERIICCYKCRNSLAEHRDVFAMSKDGVQSTYCNPGGHVYETVTITQINNYTVVGAASKKFSWFPGYNWTIIQCQTCRSHIGWKFTSKYLQPPMFFGLARASLDIKILNSSDNSLSI